MDWSEKNLCIKCNEGGNVLVCSENGCPLAIHEGCMGCPARFDDAGQYYCPYCLYKQAVSESRRAREYALARKKALLVFMDEEMTRGEKYLEENERAKANGRNQPKISAVNVNATTCDRGERGRNSDSIYDQSIHLGDKDEIRNAGEDKVQEVESETSVGSEGQEPSIEMHEDQNISSAEGKKIQEEEEEPSLASSDEEPSLELTEDQQISNAEERKIQEEEEEPSLASSDEEPSLEVTEDQKISNAEERKIQEEEEEISSASSDQEPSLKNKHKISDAEEENVQEDECETSSASTDQDPSLEAQWKDKRASKRKKPIDRNSQDVSRRSKRVKKSDQNKQTPPSMTPTRRSSRRSSSATKTQKALNEKVGSSKRSKQAQQSSVKLANHTFGSGKRKRLLWREEEEEMLKEGVRKYAEEGNKNHPWRKILEYGQKVFDETRTPIDLKDKWRNMLAK